MINLLLCQDCLLVAQAPDIAFLHACHDGRVSCPRCSGDFCACSSCVVNAKSLPLDFVFYRYRPNPVFQKIEKIVNRIISFSLKHNLLSWFVFFYLSLILLIHVLLILDTVEGAL